MPVWTDGWMDWGFPMTAPERVGIVFNAYEPRPIDTGERLSEEAVVEMAYQVGDAVQSLGIRTTYLPLGRDLPAFLSQVSSGNYDVLINLCEGYCGRPQWESNIAGILELLQVPFTGASARNTTLCQDMHHTKAVLQYSGLPTAPGRLLASADQPIDIGFPVIVKPNNEDASLGISAQSVVHDQQGLRRQVQQVLDYYRQPALVEAYLDGREFNVAVMQSTTDVPLPVSEIDYSQLQPGLPRICSYEAKWFEDDPWYWQTPPVCPAHIDEELRQRLQGLAVAAFRTTGCRDYARVDFRTDVRGQIYILEVNPNPDVSHNAGYARALTAAGIDYAVFWETMINNALRRKHDNDSPRAAGR